MTGQQVTAEAGRLMDSLLSVEHAAFDDLDTAVQRVADATRERLIGFQRAGRERLLRQQPLPGDRWLTDLLLPSIADVAAVARERAVGTMTRQIGMVGQLVGDRAHDVAQAAIRDARAQAVQIERTAVADASVSLQYTAQRARGRIIQQRRIWQSRGEPFEALVSRVCSAERVALPGAGRGAVWQMRAGLHALARDTSVRTANQLLETGIRCWNVHALAS